MMPIDIGLSLSNSSGAKNASPFNVTSGGQQQIMILLAVIGVVAVLGLILWLKK